MSNRLCFTGTSLLHLHLLHVFFIASSLLPLVHSFYPTRDDPKESFTRTIESYGHQLEEHHLITKDDRVFTVHRVVPKGYDANYNAYRIPVVILNGVLSNSAVYYIDSPFLNRNGSFCGLNLGFCMILTGRYDLWILNSDDLDSNAINTVRFFESQQPDKFWVSSLLSFSKSDVAAFISLIQRVTSTKQVAFVGYTSGSMFGLMSVLPKYESLFKPFAIASGAQYIGKSNREFVTVAPLFRKIPQLYIGAEVMAEYLSQVDETPRHGNKVCAVMIVEPLEKEARDSRFDYGEPNWHLKAEGAVNGRKEVNFHIVLLYGDHDWAALLMKLEHLMDMLRNAGDYLVEHGCFKTRGV